MAERDHLNTVTLVFKDPSLFMGYQLMVSNAGDLLKTVIIPMGQ